MSDVNRPRTRLSREMRLLIVTILIAGGVLLLLARLRFPELPVPLDTSQPLERLAARASFEELATRVARLEAAIAPNLIVLSLTPVGDPRPIHLGDASVETETDREVRHVPALRIDATTAAACMPRTARIEGIVGQPSAADAAAVVATDPIRQIARVRVPEGRPVALRQLALSALQTPSYIVAVEGTRAGVTIRPVFLGRSDRFNSPRWTRPLLPFGGTLVTSGALMFTLEGEFLGCAVVDQGTAAIASSTDVLEAMSRVGSTVQTLAEPGIGVQAISAGIASATGAADGVVVAEVVPLSPASGLLEPGDVIVEVEGRPVRDPESLLLDLGTRLASGPVRISFIRERQTHQGVLQRPAPPPPAAGSARRDALKFELVRGAGARVVSVSKDSPLATAGLRPDDVIVRIGKVSTPTPAQVESALRDAPGGQFLLLVVRRGTTQHVTAVRKEDRADVASR